MSSVQSISLSNRGFLIGPTVTNARNSSLSWASYTNSTCLYAVPSIEFSQCKAYPRLVHSARKSERCAPVYASGKRGNSKSGNEVHLFMVAFSFLYWTYKHVLAFGGKLCALCHAGHAAWPLPGPDVTILDLSMAFSTVVLGPAWHVTVGAATQCL